VLRVELTTQVVRMRTLLALALLAAVPVLAGLSFASSAGHRNGEQTGLFGASPYSALNHAMASLAFIAPLLLPVVVSLLATAIGSADRDWGVLRYVFVAPVDRTRLLTAKLAAAALATAAAVAVVVAAGLAVGLALFGWHPFHRIGSAALGTGDAVGRSLVAVGYTFVCMLAMAAIAFALAVALPRGAEALAVSVGFVVAASMVDSQPALHRVVVLLPIHYWQRWTTLFEPGGTAGLLTGVLVQLATIVVCATVAGGVLRRRDPAA
jgi:ABC-2 type transport system permease protein